MLKVIIGTGARDAESQSRNQVKTWSQMVVNQHSFHQHCLVRWVTMPWSDDTMNKLRDGFFLMFGILKAGESSVVEQRLLNFPNQSPQSIWLWTSSCTATPLKGRRVFEAYYPVLASIDEIGSRVDLKDIQLKRPPPLMTPHCSVRLLCQTALSDDAAVIFQESKSCCIAEKRFQECW